MMFATQRLVPRLRVVAISIALAATSFAWGAAPVPPASDPASSSPIGLGFAVQPVDAAYCATPNPAFTGRLTSSSSSTTAITQSATGNVYGYISNVDDDWACTLYYRYDGLAWNTSASVGTFDWGLLIHSDSVSCNWGIGTDDYLKANSTSDCPDFDAEYAMQTHLDPEWTYVASSSHTAQGQFSFAHVDCTNGTYYGAQVTKTGASFSGSSGSNRPGANCDSMTLDSTGTSQTIVVDWTGPDLNIDTPASGLSVVATTSYNVQFDATDNLAGFGGSNGWTLTRQIASWNGSSCGTFSDDTGQDAVVTGTTAGNDQTSTQTLTVGPCYRWILTGTDQNGNAGNPDTSGEVRVDSTAPTATIDQAAGQDDPANSSPIDFTLTFNEPITGLTDSDITIGGTAPGTLSASIAGTGPYTVSISGMTGPGTVTASLAASTVTDLAGNPNVAATSTDNSVTYDATAPTATIDQAAGQADPTGDSPIEFTLTFSEPITGLTDSDITIGGTVPGTLSASITGTGPYTVSISGMTGDGTVTASLAASVVTDLAGNPNAASTSTDNSVSYVVDTTPPTATIEQAAGQADPTNAGPIEFTLTFSEPITGLDDTDITIGGTATGTLSASITGTGPYTVSISGMTGDGTVTASLAASVVTDLAGNPNTASTSTDNSVTYDTTPPTSTGSTPSSTSSRQVAVTWTASDAGGVGTVSIGYEVDGYWLACATVTGTSGVTDCTVHADGTFDFGVAVADLAGNTLDYAVQDTTTISSSYADHLPNLAPDGLMSVDIGGLAYAFDLLPASSGNDGNLGTEVGRTAYSCWCGDTEDPGLNVSWWYWDLDLGHRYAVSELEWWEPNNAFGPTKVWGSNDGGSWTELSYTTTWKDPIDTFWHINITGTRPTIQFAEPQPYQHFRVGNEFATYDDLYYVGRRSFFQWAVLGDPTPLPDLPSEPAPDGTELQENGAHTGDPVDAFSGAFTYVHNDIAISGRGPTPSLTRSYNSADTRTGPMGPGWTHTYNMRLREPGDLSGDILFVRASGNTDRFALQTDGSYEPAPATYAILVENPDGSYTVTELDGREWAFDHEGNLTAITDRYGNTSTLTYNANGELESVSDPAGRGLLTFAYTNGLLTSVTDWLSPSRTVAYSYDTSGRLETVTDREGEETTFTYDSTSQRITTITDARSHVALTLTYDGQGRVATQKDARGLTSGDTTTFSYVVNGDGTRETTTTSPATSFESSFTPTTEDHFTAEGWITSRTVKPSSTETLTETYTYDAIGNRTSVTNARGYTTNYCYDVDYSGSAISGSRGNLTRVIAPAPTGGADRPVTLTSYDSKNNVTQIVTPKGVPSGTTVTCATDLSSITTAYATDFTYDATSTLLLATTSRATDPELGLQTSVTKYEYSDASNPGLVTRIIPARGNTGGSPDYSYATTLTYNGSGSQAGLLASREDALGNTTTFTYDAVGRLVSSVDPLGNEQGASPADHETTMTYDKEDRVRFVSQPAPTSGGADLVTETRYDEVGNPVVRIDANGQVTTYAYDERDALSEVHESPSAWTDPASPPGDVITTEYGYDAWGNLTRVLRAKDDSTYERATDYTYDGRNLVRSEKQYPSWPSTSGALTTTTTYTATGLVAVTTDALSRTTTMSYDTLDRPTGIDYSDTGTPDVTWTYDENGNRASMVDGTGTTTYTYDESERLLSVTSPGSVTVGYRYDLDGNRTKLIYPDATAVTYAFDKAGRLASLTDWDSQTTSYTYEADGLPSGSTNVNATTTTYAYDNARRLLEITHAGSGQTIEQLTYTLDAIGNVTSLERPSAVPSSDVARPDGLAGSNGTWSGTYADINEATADDGDYLDSPADPAAGTYYEVTLADATLPVELADIIVRYRYAKSGNNGGQKIDLTVELREGTTVIASLTHTNIDGVDGSGWQAGTLTLSAGERAAISDPSDLRLRFNMEATTGGQSRSGRVSWAEVEFAGYANPGSDDTYTYDHLYRLTDVSGTSGDRTYTYDPVGNRLSLDDGSTTNYTYDAADRITAAGSTSITVNAVGATTAKGSDSFTYDQANRLTSATVGGTTETYTYDGDGVRFSRQVGTDPTIRYVTDVNRGLPVTIDDGTRKYVWGIGLAYAVSGSDIEVYHADRLGSTRMLTDGSGTAIARYLTDEYGNPIASTGSSTQPYEFTGEPRDGTGLVYLRARYFDAMLGRFATRDSYGGQRSGPQSLNRFVYAKNSPTSKVDPSGHRALLKPFGGPKSSVLTASPAPWDGGPASVAVCLTGSLGIGWYISVEVCVAGSTGGQIGLVTSGSTGPMYGATASAGVGVLVAPTGNLNDLSGDFSTYGASAGFGPWAGADLAVPDSGSDIYSLSVKGGAGFDINPLGPFEVHGGWGKTGVLAIGINDVSDWIEQTFFAAGGGGGF